VLELTVSLDSFIFPDVIIPTSLLLSVTSFFFLAAIFGDALFVRFDLKTFIKFLGFLILGISVILSSWMMSVGFVLIFVGFIIDPLSKAKFILPLPIVFFPFLTDHILFFVLSLITTVAVFQLAYVTKHQDFIPLGVGFTLISVGEYFYHLENVEQLKQLALAGSFLYLFASLVLLGWGWSYLVLRFKNKFKPDQTE